MTKRLLLVFLISTSSLGAEPYDLLWQHLSVPISQDRIFEVPDPTLENYDKDPVYKPEKPEVEVPRTFSSWRDMPPKLRSRLWPKKTEKDEYAKPLDLTIEASQDYDHYKGRYRLVSRVESWVYRRSYYQHIIHCNRASYTRFDVTLQDLEKGDRFQMRIVWDDGSHRTLDQVMGDNPETKIYINEPGYLEY